MKRIKKIAIVLVVALLFSVVVLPISASAASPKADVTASENCSLEVVALYTMVYVANEAIELAVRLAQLTPYNDVPALLIAVEAIASGVKAYAESIGAEIACEYTEYVIDGQTVLIDPLRVINIPGHTGGGNGN